ncbi:MAG TPA: DNA polymerase ligase N-terminal domain-containing protein [Candidatus Saccharimonadales bacterium]|nr:DNA polymerase ligase N-terminal domain-containing protein [Candidatus Saccharimonadales bacterium]
MQQLVFVIHKHHATSLHYDFRLEIGGVMPSWAIAKGPTLDNTVKRLALSTTDHEMNYRHFEGVIPAGSYGAGPVMIWDEGYYIPEIEISKGVRKSLPDRHEGEEAMKEGLKKGELKFILHGKKMKGSFALVKTKGWGPKNSWLLIKHNDESVESGYDANDYDNSAKSNKTLSQIAGEEFKLS